MVDFVQTMKDWKRMCNAMATCDECPMNEVKCWGKSPSDLIDSFERRESVITEWAAEHPEPEYPSIAKYLEQLGITIRRDGSLEADFFKANEPMSADMAKMLGISSRGV